MVNFSPILAPGDTNIIELYEMGGHESDRIPMTKDAPNTDVNYWVITMLLTKKWYFTLNLGELGEF